MAVQHQPRLNSNNMKDLTAYFTDQFETIQPICQFSFRNSKMFSIFIQVHCNNSENNFPIIQISQSVDDTFDNVGHVYACFTLNKKSCYENCLISIQFRKMESDYQNLFILDITIRFCPSSRSEYLEGTNLTTTTDTILYKLEVKILLSGSNKCNVSIFRDYLHEEQ